jgi:hypothetical protein
LNGTNQLNDDSRLATLGISREDITQFINVGHGLSVTGHFMSHTLRTNDTINPDRIFTWNEVRSHVLQEIKFNGIWSSLNLPNGDEGGAITDGDNDSFLRYYSVVSSFLYGLGGGWNGVGVAAYVLFQHKVTKAYKILKISNTDSFNTANLLITANLVDSGNPPFETWMNSKLASHPDGYFYPEAFLGMELNNGFGGASATYTFTPYQDEYRTDTTEMFSTGAGGGHIQDKLYNIYIYNGLTTAHTQSRSVVKTFNIYFGLARLNSTETSLEKSLIDVYYQRHGVYPRLMHFTGIGPQGRHHRTRFIMGH